MSASKHFDKIAWVAIALTLVITILFMNGAALGISVMAHTMGYENRLFDNTRVHTIDIVMSDWDTFIANAATEEYYVANIVIDGEAYKNVGIRGKGNTSLSNVQSMGSERYSFKIEFDQYDSTLHYYGLDKLCLNNLIQDSTMMKDYLTYTMMNAFGVHAPLCSFVYITVNGEDWGLYLAVEGVEEAFLERNYGSDYGELYKPDSMSFGGGRGNGKDFSMDDFMNNADFSDLFDVENGVMENAPFDMPTMTEAPNMEMPSMPDMNGVENFDFSVSDMPSDMEMPDMGGFGGMGSEDVKLQYIDENIDSYSNIWDSAKTDISEADQTRLMDSLRKLSTYEDVESVVDIEQVVRYFVVHNYVCNGDSYTGSMVHNYYLYEKDGRLAMIPWDYNLAFGTFQGGSVQSAVNEPIDSPVDGGDADDRPMWGWILSNEEYISLYHQYFAEFLETVDISGIIDGAYTLIQEYVEKDPTKFFTYEEFEIGVETLKQFCALRSDSIAAQLENGKTTETMNYADASALNLSDMGSMTSGGFNGDDRSGKQDMFQKNDGMMRDTAPVTSEMGVSADASPVEIGTGNADETVTGESMKPDGTDPGLATDAFPTDEPTTGESVPGEPIKGFGGQNPGEMPNDGNMPDRNPSWDFDGNQNFSPEAGMNNAAAEVENDRSSDSDENNMQSFGGENREFSRDDAHMNMDREVPAGKNNAEWIWLAVSAVILCAGLVVAKVYNKY